MRIDFNTFLWKCKPLFIRKAFFVKYKKEMSMEDKYAIQFLTKYKKGWSFPIFWCIILSK